MSFGRDKGSPLDVSCTIISILLTNENDLSIITIARWSTDMSHSHKLNTSARYTPATEVRSLILHPVHHACVRLATGAIRSSPISSILVDAGILSLDLHRNCRMRHCWYRPHRFPDFQSCQTVSKTTVSRIYASRLSVTLSFGLRVQDIL